MLCLETLSCALPRLFLKMFHLQQSRYHRFSMVQQFLLHLQRIRSRWFLLFDQEKACFLFNLFRSYQKNCYRKKMCLPQCRLCYRVNICRPVKLLNSYFVIFRRKLSTTTYLTIPRFFSMNISLGKSTKFPIPSISIPSMARLNHNNFVRGVFFFFSENVIVLEIEILNVSISAKEVSYILFHIIYLFAFSARKICKQSIWHLFNINQIITKWLVN